MAEIIDGKKLAKKIRQELKEEVIKENLHPRLAVILVGDDEASKIYIRNKSRACEDVGIEFIEHILPTNTTMEELLELINKLNNDNEVSGILLQSPLPGHMNIKTAFETINPEKDVDGFNPINIGRLEMNEPAFVSCTPYGVIRMLEEYNIDIEGKTAVVIGRSNIVGKPLIQLLLNKNATVIVTHSRTKNLENYTRQADILVSAIGKAKYIKADMVKEGAVVIDVGINRIKGDVPGKKVLVGDTDYSEVSKKASYITPVPGGVGPMTIAMLMHNVVKAEKLKNK